MREKSIEMGKILSLRSLAIAAMALACSVSVMADDAVRWLNTVYDFGAFDEDTNKKTAYFRFVNTGAEDVSIVSATATCGCTTPKYSTDPIAPGDTAVVEVSYDPSGRPGRFDKQLYVRTSASLERTRLTIRGTVIGNAETIGARYPVSIGDMKMRNGAAMMGRVYHGHGKTQYVDIYNQSADTIAPVATQAPGYIQVACEPQAVPPGEMATLSFYFSGSLCDTWGMVADSVYIAPRPGAEGAYFPVVAIVEEDFSSLTSEQRANAPRIAIDGDRVMLPPIPEHSTRTVTTRVKVSNNGASPLIIRRVYTQDQGVEVAMSRYEIKPGGSAYLSVSFDPSRQPTGIVNGKVSIVTNDPDKPTVTLRVVGERN